MVQDRRAGPLVGILPAFQLRIYGVLAYSQLGSDLERRCVVLTNLFNSSAASSVSVPNIRHLISVISCPEKDKKIMQKKALNFFLHLICYVNLW